MHYKKNTGYAGEQIVATHYTTQGYSIVAQNYTIRGGEIDIIAENDTMMVFVEVKVINNVEDIAGYVTAKKIGHIHKTIAYYFLTHPSNKSYRLDVAFVKQNRIFDVYENVTNT